MKNIEICSEHCVHSEEIKDIIENKLRQIMEESVLLKVKLKVEGSLGKTWYDCK